MFKKFTAWFSQSVASKYISIWEKQGGKIDENVDECDFFFSEDAEAQDTKVFYATESTRSYGNGEVCVFHPMFIDDCAREGGVGSVAIGDYVLPPISLQQMVKQQLGYRYKWETTQSGDVHVSEVSEFQANGQAGESMVEPITESDRCQPARQEASCLVEHDGDYADIESLIQVSDDVEEFIPQDFSRHRVVMIT